MNEFKRGCISTHDESHSGRPVGAATPEIIEKVHDVMFNNRGVEVRDIVKAIGISHGT